MKFARVTLSDRATAGVYEDRSGPAIEGFFAEHLADADRMDARPHAGRAPALEALLRRLCEEAHGLVVTTGGTGPRRATSRRKRPARCSSASCRALAKSCAWRSYEKVKTAILSRATAGTRGRTLIVNLPGNPRAIGECLPLILPAIVEAIDHLCGERLRVRAGGV